MSAGIILIIILLGLLLIFVEIFFIPGTTLFGVVGAIALIVGVIFVYFLFGNWWGNLTVAISLFLVAVAVIAGFKVIQSNKLAMKGEITGKVNQLDRQLFHVGDKGTAVAEIKPNGKAMFGDNKVDVYSNGEYIQRESEVEIIRITNDKIFVKLSKS